MNKLEMDRREFLQCAAVLIGGAGLGQVAFALSPQQLGYLSAADDYIDSKVEFFSASQRQLVTALAEAIIPRTETPGAADAGVPRFIELMVTDWFNDQERGIFLQGLTDLQKRIPEEFGHPFHQLEAAQQVAILESLEAQASDSSWYQPGNVRRAFISDAPFICQIKELTIWGFFTSEDGVKEVLRYQPMPMKFDGDTPREPGDTTWAPVNFYR